MVRPLSRRRFISITASAVGLGLLPLGASAKLGVETVTWEGEALGASASMTVHHTDKVAAELLVRQAHAELSRLERIFSLYRDDTALSELNRTGVLAAPPRELVEILGKARMIWEQTGGAFDPSIQPLWSLLARHFGGADPDPSGPSEERLRKALDLVDYGDVLVSGDRIALGRRGMALTLNGIAQGFIADSIVGVLRRGGVANSLVNMGEIRALGSRPDGNPWRVGVGFDGHGAAHQHVLEIADRAVATSSPDGYRFADGGRFNHILDPRSGLGASLYCIISVIAPDAMTADAFSTGFSLLPPERIQKIAAARPGLQVKLQENSDAGSVLEF
ncbi:FAD:protein FMN transferase [Aurantimonas sp. NFXS3]|uniref:FAD:protein FMN transferase n=1 Tax=Aurantimonas sp. NFXS3 TaxID=2818434 RepID=UPI003B8DB972